ncbi:hypothetical protein VitviT2T_025137 [Vitis vinifera]|uniref:UDP-N-acetylmuramate--L-alanine ligase n=1 Tax=Vitis vinifera TaxID=29760 RepID=A0ABY9DJQ7_VITVI|nr:uncharacterized protein LOC100855090 isoform X2 [Vitis vinifera]WKA07292.1 hypothetical protein VitviT2T_025137 [Vitis vinifera]|eukprot:XP_010662683.1 PREDICTED: uncharacterized protein LOC100855090 isoform X2 [Vitis vinifera]
MEFSAISPSNSLHFPTNFLGKIMTHFMVRPRNATFSCRTLQIQTLASNLEESSRVSFSTRSRADIKNEESFVLGNRKGWIHFVGIGGSGLSALAMLALKQGFEVSGSDIVWSSFLDGLKETGAQLHLGHSESNIQRNNGSSLPDAIVVSSAIPQDNLEILHAKSVGIPVYKRGNWLGKLTEHYNLIAVSGTHGKSTTASMLAYVLKSMGDDLTAVVGAQVPQFGGGNIMSGSGRNFVLEADEYDCCFLGLLPYIAVVTNVDWEHVDIFPDEEAVKAIFRRFLKQIRVGGHLILCGDSAGACSLLDDTEESTVADHSSGKLSTLNSDKCSDGYRITTFGISRTNEWHALSIRPNSQGGSDFVLCHRGYPVANITLQIPGVHNVLNSLAVIATVMALVSDGRQSYESINCVKIHLNNFVGVSRRFELIGTVCGCLIYDDYAHHPTEVRAVLQAARQRFPLKALLVVFQPHTYSRLAALKSDFATAFSDADQVLVTEIYAARETNVWNVSGKDLATSIIGPPSEYIPSLGDVVDKLAHQISLEPDRETVVFTLGAGDITTVGPKLLHELQGRLQK